VPARTRADASTSPVTNDVGQRSAVTAAGEHADGVRGVRCPDTVTAVEWFRRWAEGDQTAEARRLPRGHDLACWGRLDQLCHADVLLELADR